MAVTIVSFVNLGRQDAFLSVAESGGDPHFVAKVSPGQVVRQASMPGAAWTVVAKDTFPITGSDKNEVLLISNDGVFVVAKAEPVKSESGVAPKDTDFPGWIGGG